MSYRRSRLCAACISVLGTLLSPVAPASALSPAAKIKIYRARNSSSNTSVNEKLAREILKDDPKCGDAHSMLGFAHYSNDRYEAAQAEFLKASALPFTTPYYKRTAYNYLYHIYVLQKDWKSALKWALKCFELEKTSGVPHDISLIYQKLGDQPNEKKYAAVSKEIELEERQIEQADHALQNPAKRPAVLKWINAKLAKQKDNLALLHLRATLYIKNKDYKRALADCTQMIALDPSYARFHIVRAEAYKRAGEKKQADADLKVARDLGLEETRRSSPSDVIFPFEY